MNPLLEKLHDIEGLDSISMWPLAIGWWVVLGVAVALVIALIGWMISSMAFRRSWKKDTLRKLADLDKNLSDSNSRTTVIELSEYLKRIALKKYSREECAGLFGSDWLTWLTKNDPKQFDWEKKGRVLIEVPYTPENKNFSTSQIKDLIKAVRNWVY